MKLCSISIKTSDKNIEKGDLLQLTIMLENSEKVKLVEDLPILNAYIYREKIEGSIDNIYQNIDVIKKIGEYVISEKFARNSKEAKSAYEEFNELYKITMEQIKNGNSISKATKDYWYNLDIVVDENNFYDILTKFLQLHGLNKKNGKIDINFLSLENSFYILSFLYKTFPKLDQYFNINKIFIHPQTHINSSKDKTFKHIEDIYEVMDYPKPQNSKDEVRYSVRLLRTTSFYN